MNVISDASIKVMLFVIINEKCRHQLNKSERIIIELTLVSRENVKLSAFKPHHGH